MQIMCYEHTSWFLAYWPLCGETKYHKCIMPTIRNENMSNEINFHKSFAILSHFLKNISFARIDQYSSDLIWLNKRKPKLYR